MKRVRDEEARLEFAGPDPSPPFEAPLLSTFFGVILLGNRIATGSWTLTDSAAACLLLISFGAIWELLFESWKRRPQTLIVDREEGIVWVRGVDDIAKRMTVARDELQTIELQFVGETATGIRVELLVHQREPDSPPTRSEAGWSDDPSELIPWNQDRPIVPPAVDERLQYPEERRGQARRRIPLLFDGVSREELPRLGAAFARVLELPIYRPHGACVVFSTTPSARAELEAAIPATDLTRHPPHSPLAGIDPPPPRVWRGRMNSSDREAGTLCACFAMIMLSVISLIPSDLFSGTLATALLITCVVYSRRAFRKRPRFDASTGELVQDSRQLTTPTRLFVDPIESVIHLELDDGWRRWRASRRTLGQVAAAMAAAWDLELEGRRVSESRD